MLRAIAAGSEPAFEELRRRYQGAVAGICRTLAGGEREDCVQEVFSRIWAKASLFDPARGSAAAWLLTVSRRTALNLRGGPRPPTPSEREPEDAYRRWRWTRSGWRRRWRGWASGSGR